MQTINQLWLLASKGKFGFSVQKQIWVDLGGNPKEYYLTERFLRRVGWGETKIVFEPRAARGHLPLGVYVNVSDNLKIYYKWWEEIDKIAKTSEKERKLKNLKIKRLEDREIKKEKCSILKDLLVRVRDGSFLTAIVFGFLRLFVGGFLPSHHILLWILYHVYGIGFYSFWFCCAGLWLVFRELKLEGIEESQVYLSLLSRDDL